MKRIALRMDDKDIMGHDMITAISDNGGVVESNGRGLRRYVGFINDIPFHAYYMFGSLGASHLQTDDCRRILPSEIIWCGVNNARIDGGTAESQNR